jgi:hypothetical protein
MSKEELMFHYWRKKLGLRDWTIRFQYNVEPEDMFIDDSCGCTTWQESGKTALIQILKPERYGDRIAPFDIEKTIVHELLHLKLSFISSECDNLQQRVAHQIIDDLAKAFVDARRENKITKETAAYEELND